MTSVYTSRWLPGLIGQVEALAAANPAFQFLFDGQTLVIEDLLALAPEYAGKVRRLVGAGQLLIGPYYCQPDWQLTHGELLLRNLQLGLADVARYGGAPGAGWLVDTFGHIRQAPQLHRLFGIEAVYVWRGVPELAPYFHWRSPDGSEVLALYLVGGYRNLYGVTHTPEVAVRRLLAEIEKLRPYYPTPDVPLFDGYDLEDSPEDPVRFLSEAGPLPPDLRVQPSTPEQFAAAIGERVLALPTLQSELNSGKYGATFPGTLSARAYLKVMAHDCQSLLFRLVEPLAALARLCGRPYPAAQYETWARALLQNAVHDAICGVSIDQVHEKMEVAYRQVFDGLRADLDASLAAVLAGFAPGDYAMSANPFALEHWVRVDHELLHVRTEGVGVWPVAARLPVTVAERPVDGLDWRNDHYAATVDASGTVHVGSAALGHLVVYQEKGDTYTDERGERLGTLALTSPLTITAASARHCEVAFTAEWSAGANRVTARVGLHFDPSPLIRWEVALDTRGTGLRVELALATGLRGPRLAGMPFDLAPRPLRDDDLLPRHLPGALGRVLLGQRELGAVETFPFQELLALSEGPTTAAIFARGLHAYRADAEGTVHLMLSRAVEWLTRADLETRAGDAGPFFYVPDARGERTVHHVVGVALGELEASSVKVQALNAGFQNPPLLVRGRGRGTQTSWPFLREEVPLSSLALEAGRVRARFYNPTTQPLPLAHAYEQLDVWGNPSGTLNRLEPGQVAAVALPHALPPVEKQSSSPSVACLAPPRWRVGENTGRPAIEVLEKLAQRAAALSAEAAEAEAQYAAATGHARLRWQHRYYVLKREAVEAEFSLLLNRRKLARAGPPSHADLFEPDPAIAALGLALNRLRIKRRIFDYVVQVLPDET